MRININGELKNLSKNEQTSEEIIKEAEDKIIEDEAKIESEKSYQQIADDELEKEFFNKDEEAINFGD